MGTQLVNNWKNEKWLMTVWKYPNGRRISLAMVKTVISNFDENYANDSSLYYNR